VQARGLAALFDRHGGCLMLPWYRIEYEAEADLAITLSPLAHALHARLRNAAWRLGALPRGNLARIAHVTPNELARAWPEIAHLWSETDPGAVCCPEIERLRAELSAQSEQQAARAAARWRNRAKPLSAPNAAALPAQMPDECRADAGAMPARCDLRSEIREEDQEIPPKAPPQAGGPDQGSLFSVGSGADLGTAAAGPKVAAKRTRKPKAPPAEPDPNAPPRIAVAKLEALLSERSGGRYIIVGGGSYWARLQRAIASLPQGLDEERAAVLGEWYRLGSGGGSGVAFVAALDHRRLTPSNLAGDLAQAMAWASAGRKAPRATNGRGAAPVGAWDDTETGRMT